MEEYPENISCNYSPQKSHTTENIDQITKKINLLPESYRFVPMLYLSFLYYMHKIKHMVMTNTRDHIKADASNYGTGTSGPILELSSNTSSYPLLINNFKYLPQIVTLFIQLLVYNPLSDNIQSSYH